MKPRMSNEQFRRKLSELYGDKYDFSEAKYETKKTVNVLTCSEHGTFTKTAGALLMGRACPLCARERMRERMLAQHDDPQWKANYAKRSEKRKATLKKRYGVDNIMKLQGVKEKVKETCIDRYGVENPMQDSNIASKAFSTNMERYGVEHYIQCEEGKRKMKETMLRKYGADNFMKTAMLQDILERKTERYRLTQLERYGADHYSRSETAKRLARQRKAKEFATKKANGTLNSSQPEQDLHKLLISIYGDDDVKAQYSNDKYPYACDFYIPSRDLYIELNAHWSHGRHWYGSCEKDTEILQKWINSSNSEYYYNSVQVWSQRDVEKRLCAKRHNLNYVVFWSQDLQDAELWVAMGCPDGKDWLKEYTWLSKH